jgi:hypothetical protein
MPRSSFAPYPAGPTGRDAIPVNASANSPTGGALTATLAAGGANVMTYISGFEVTLSNFTAAATATITVTGTLGGTLNYTMQSLTAGAAVPPLPPLIVEFPEPIQASALNTAIVVNVPANASSGASVVSHGFQLPFSS